MLSIQLFEYYNFILTKIGGLWSESEHITYIENYRNRINDFTEYVVDLSSRDSTIDINDTQMFMSQLRNSIDIIKNDIDYYSAIVKMQNVKNEIQLYEKNNNIENSIMNFFLSPYENFLKKCLDFIRSNSIKRDLYIMNELDVLISKQYELSGIERLISIYNEDPEIELESEQIFELQLLGVEYPFEDFTGKLSIINKVYNSIGSIVYNDQDQKFIHLEIIKIESGSLFAKIFGDKNIISVLSKLLEKVIGLCFSKFTYEGKLSRHSEIVKHIREDIEMCKMLGEMGIDTTFIMEDLTETFAISVKGLREIALSSPHIKLNGVEYSLDSNMKEKYFHEVKVSLLGDKEDMKQ